MVSHGSSIQQLGNDGLGILVKNEVVLIQVLVLPSHGSQRSLSQHNVSNKTIGTCYHQWDPLIAQLVKNPPAMKETPIQFLGQKDPLEKG